MTDTTPELIGDEMLDRYTSVARAIEAAVATRIVGQRDVIRNVLIGLLCQGHLLLEGVPGLGKTELLKALSASVDGELSRIQFTPDLMPADIIGTQVLETGETGERRFVFRPGPVFANFVLADEINRATPKSQSALLEAMQERTVTVAGQTRALPSPFLVLATQNPIELEGTYPLPEAQLDRFMMKVDIGSPPPDALAQILSTTTTGEPPPINPVCTGEELAWMITVTRGVPVPRHLIAYTALLVSATHPGSEHAPPELTKYVRMGASPRGGQAIVLAAKARALLAGRPNVAVQDVDASVLAALRHRLILGYEATADGVAVDELLLRVVAECDPPHPQLRGTG